MSASLQAVHDAKVAELAEQYAHEGYEVFFNPEPHLFPFDLGGYTPDLLVRKEGEHSIVEVKASGTHVSIDRIRRVVDEVRQLAGWHFRLVTFDEVEAGLLPGDDGALPPWEQLREQTVRAERLLKLKEPAAAFLLLWATLEGALRKQAETAGLPIERFQPRLLIQGMYQQGEISLEQFKAAEALLETRNRVAHGFQSPDVSEAVPTLLRLVRELLGEWASGRQAA